MLHVDVANVFQVFPARLARVLTMILLKQCAIWVLAVKLLLKQVLDLLLIPMVFLVRLALADFLNCSNG